jgi:Protein of unknown function (DUF2958)
MTQAGVGKSFAPAYVLKRIPAFNTYDDAPILDDIPLVAKWFSPYNGWRWYAAEYDPDTDQCWGYVEGWEGEWGHFSLSEMQDAYRGKLPLIERDHYFSPTTLRELRAKGDAR